MKKFSLFVLCILVSLGCLAQTVRQPQNLFIANSDGQVKIQAIDDTQTTVGLPWLVFGSQSNAPVFLIPSSGILGAAYGGTGSSSGGTKSGTIVTSTDGTGTNTFATAFTSVPNVVITPLYSHKSTTNYISSITTSNFVVVCSEATVTNQWIAVGR